jgi:uncharacterized integral membrane protein
LESAVTIRDFLQSLGISRRIIDGALNAAVLDLPLSYVAFGIFIIGALLLALGLFERLRQPRGR